MVVLLIGRAICSAPRALAVSLLILGALALSPLPGLLYPAVPQGTLLAYANAAEPGEAAHPPRPGAAQAAVVPASLLTGDAEERSPLGLLLLLGPCMLVSILLAIALRQEPGQPLR